MHKICVLTATRAEYGLLRWLMQDIRDDPGLMLQVVVTGAHLVPRFGDTWRQLEADGFEIDAKVEMLDPSDASPAALVRSTGECALGLADVFARLAPDMLVILGDRYELMPAATAALPQQAWRRQLRCGTAPYGNDAKAESTIRHRRKTAS